MELLHHPQYRVAFSRRGGDAKWLSLQIVLSKLTFRAGGAESGPGIGPKHRGIAGSITERTDIEGGCRLAGVMNDINHDDFSTQIVISKFLVIDFHRFSSIFAKFAKFDDNFITET